MGGTTARPSAAFPASPIADLHLASAFSGTDLVEYIDGSPYVDEIVAQPWRLDAEGMLTLRGRKKDMLLHHPFQSFVPVLEFVRCAAHDHLLEELDATLPGGLGTFGYDDEGVPARRTPLVRRLMQYWQS